MNFRAAADKGRAAVAVNSVWSDITEIRDRRQATIVTVLKGLMKLTQLCEIEMHDSWTEFVDYGVGGQDVGRLGGTVTGNRLTGTLRSVNVPAKRPDNAKIYFDFNGIALLRAEDKARVFLSLEPTPVRTNWRRFPSNFERPPGWSSAFQVTALSVRAERHGGL